MLGNDTFENILNSLRARGEVFRKWQKKSTIFDEMHLQMTPLTSNESLSFSNLKPAPLRTESSSIKLYSSKISNIKDHFWNKWRKEYMSRLREYRKIFQPNENLPTIDFLSNT